MRHLDNDENYTGRVESYIACRYKAYLMLAGHEAETGHKNEQQEPTNSEQVSL